MLSWPMDLNTKLKKHGPERQTEDVVLNVKLKMQF